MCVSSVLIFDLVEVEQMFYYINEIYVYTNGAFNQCIPFYKVIISFVCKILIPNCSCQINCGDKMTICPTISLHTQVKYKHLIFAHGYFPPLHYERVI